MLAIRFDYTQTNALNETSEIVLSADNILDIFERELSDCVYDCALPMTVMYTVQIDHCSETTTSVSVDAALVSMQLGACVAFDAHVDDKTIFSRRFRSVENLRISIDGSDSDMPYSMKFMSAQGDMITSGEGEVMRYTNLHGDCVVWHCKTGYSISAWYDGCSDCAPEIDSDGAIDPIPTIVICSFVNV